MSKQKKQPELPKHGIRRSDAKKLFEEQFGEASKTTEESTTSSLTRNPSGVRRYMVR